MVDELDEVMDPGVVIILSDHATVHVLGLPAVANNVIPPGVTPPPSLRWHRVREYINISIQPQK